jgi:hypothetical protein
MGLHAGPLPRASNERVLHVEAFGQATRRPMCRAIGRRLARPTENARFQVRSQGAWTGSLVTGPQSRQASGDVAGFPRGNGLRRARQPFTNRTIGVTVGQQ